MSRDLPATVTLAFWLKLPAYPESSPAKTLDNGTVPVRRSRCAWFVRNAHA